MNNMKRLWSSLLYILSSPFGNGRGRKVGGLCSPAQYVGSKAKMILLSEKGVGRGRSNTQKEVLCYQAAGKGRNREKVRSKLKW